MTDLNRERVLACLEALGQEDDQAVLAAARDLHGQIAEAGADWHDLLQPENMPEDTEEQYAATADEDHEDDHEEEEEDEDEDEEEEEEEEDDDGDAPTPPPIPLDSGDDLAIIEALLSRRKLYEGTRAELEDYKADIEAGEFTADDKKYLRSLAARLKK